MFKKHWRASVALFIAVVAIVVGVIIWAPWIRYESTPDDTYSYAHQERAISACEDTVMTSLSAHGSAQFTDVNAGATSEHGWWLVGGTVWPTGNPDYGRNFQCYVDPDGHADPPTFDQSN